MAAHFLSEIEKGYTFEGPAIILGSAIYEGEVLPNAKVSIPLRMLNRHGLISGATGTGKTKTLQLFAEQLSEQGIPVLLMDIKGDLSGLAAAADDSPRLRGRMEKIGLPWQPVAYPVEMLSISDEPGARVRATVSEFGPELMARILKLNDTQSAVLAMTFRFCEDHDMLLIDLEDLRKALQFVTNEGKADFERDYGKISSFSSGVIIRNILKLEDQGGNRFFGELSFEIDDLMRIDEKGRGMINIIRLSDMQGKPDLFSTFMLCLLAEIYYSLPEEGDLEAPKLVLFLDEAHLIFREANEALLDQIEVMVKLIRSKGVGIFFCTQDPQDVPDEVLSQLGLKVQHALRAFTAKDRKAIRLAAENFPETSFYKTDQLITELGIGEALVTALDEKGRPTPLVATMLRAPQSRMDVLTEDEICTLTKKSELVQKYAEAIDRESAAEILEKKLEAARSEAHQEKLEKEKRKTGSGKSRQEKPVWEKVVNSSAGRTVVREVTRGLLGVIGLGGGSRRKKSWF